MQNKNTVGMVILYWAAALTAVFFAKAIIDALVNLASRFL